MAPPRKPVDARLRSRIELDANKCWIWCGSKTRDGYGVLGIGRGHQVRAHRASFAAYKGPIPSGAQVCHSCDVPLCINPDHLFLGTAKDNAVDMRRKGRGVNLKGEQHPLVRLSDKSIAEIRALRKDGFTLAYIGNKYGVSFQYVSGICLGKYR